MRRTLPALVAAILLAATTAHAVDSIPRAALGVTIVDKRGKDIPMDLTFTDHTGGEVTLGRFFGDGKPVLLTLNYFGCTMICDTQLRSIAEALEVLGNRHEGWHIGENFRVLTVSIDHREDAALARKARARLTEVDYKLGADVDWTFLVGSKINVLKLAEAVGFRFRYLPEQDEFAHPPVIMFLSPEGKVMAYRFGSKFKSRDLMFTLMEAAEGRVGSAIDKIYFSCFHYDETLGEYTPFATNVMKIGGLVTVAVIALFLAVWWRRERKRRRGAEQSDA